MQRACWKLFLFGLVSLSVSHAATTLRAQPADDAAPPSNEAEAKPEPPPTLEDSPLLKQPETPEGNLEAALLMVKLARPELAKLYLDKVLTPKPSDELLLKLHDQHGPAVFLQLSNNLKLRPQSTRLLELMTEAFRRRGADQQRIVGLISDLSGTPRERETALTALRNAGPVVVPQLLLQFDQVQNADQRALLLTALVRMGRQVVPALLGTLESPNQNLRSVAVEALGLLRAREAVPYLYYPAFADDQTVGMKSVARQALARILSVSAAKVGGVSSYGAAERLQEIALSHYRNDYPWQADEDGTVSLWTWQEQTGTVGVSQLSPEAASLYVGMRFARQALALDPDDAGMQSLYLGFALAADRLRVGWDQPLPTGPGTTHDLALTLGEGVVSLTLAQALENQRADAAIAALEVLSLTATEHQLLEQQPGRAPIVAALSYPDFRVQFAAATTVLQIDPDEPFRNSPRIVSILARAMMDDGGKGALIVHANAETSRGLGGFLSDMGYEPRVALTGQGGPRVAAERSDVSLILLEINTIRWGLSQTIANLRADARTAGIPIVIFGPNGMQERVAGLLSRNPRLTYIVTPATSDAMRSQVEPFLKSFQTPQETADQRSARRQTASYWLAHIAGGRRTRVFDVMPAERALVAALNDPDLAGNALVALGAVPTQAVQQQLAVLATSEGADVRLRESAAVQLGFHILRFGALIDERDVLAIRASRDAAADPALSTALAAVLGILKPDAQRAGERLLKFPPPPITSPPAAAAPPME